MPLTWRVAKYGKCGSTLAYSSNLGNKNKPRELKTTHLSLYTSKQHSLLSTFNIADMAIMWPTRTITVFARDQHDWYGEIIIHVAAHVGVWLSMVSWRVAKYGKCGSILAYLSNLGNKNKARVLRTTHLSLYTSKQHLLLSTFNVADMAIMWPTRMITIFACDQHDWYGKLSYMLPPTHSSYVCITGPVQYFITTKLSPGSGPRYKNFKFAIMYNVTMKFEVY